MIDDQTMEMYAECCSMDQTSMCNHNLIIFVSSPCQGVLLYTFQEGHGILEQKIRVVSQLCAQAFRFTHESLKPHPFLYNLGSQLSNFIRVLFCNMLTLLYNLYM